MRDGVRPAAKLRCAWRLGCGRGNRGPLRGGGSGQSHTADRGGRGAAITNFPFQVALYDPHAGSVAAGFFCGGVIIDATHVATAAHCAIDESTGRVTSPRNIAVLAGSARLGEAGQTPGAGAGAVEDAASATTLDPSYEPASNDYDAAVIRLVRPLWQGASPPALDGRSNIAPIPVSAALAAAYANPDTAGAPILATVSGWGDMRAESPGSQGLGGAYPSNLQATQIPLVGSNACGNAYSGPLSSQLITPRMLCAGRPRGRQGFLLRRQRRAARGRSLQSRACAGRLRAGRARELRRRLRSGGRPGGVYGDRRPGHRRLPDVQPAADAAGAGRLRAFPRRARLHSSLSTLPGALGRGPSPSSPPPPSSSSSPPPSGSRLVRTARAWAAVSERLGR